MHVRQQEVLQVFLDLEEPITNLSSGVKIALDICKYHTGINIFRCGYVCALE